MSPVSPNPLFAVHHFCPILQGNVPHPPWCTPLPISITPPSSASLLRSATEDGSLPPPTAQGPVLSDRRRCLALDEAELELCNGCLDTVVWCWPRRGETTIPATGSPGVPVVCMCPPPLSYRCRGGQNEWLSPT